MMAAKPTNGKPTTGRAAIRFSLGWILVLSAIGVMPVGAGEANRVAEPDVSAVLARVQILPLKDDAVEADASPSGGSGEKADAATDAVPSRFAKWIRHEDEFLSFSMPDDPRIRLEIKTPKDPIRLGGGPAVRSGGITFFRCYRLTFQGDTYCLLFLDRTSEFDDSICFCGAVAFDKNLEHHGSLYQFSLLEDGRVKKIQVLGEGLRLAMMEWTHLPIDQENYARIGLSVRWKRPPRDLKALTAAFQRTYGKVGFLERGMDRDALVALLGQPTTEEKGLLRYVFQKSYDPPPGSQRVEYTWDIPLTNGRFDHLSPDWSRYRSLPPEPQSVQWILAKLEGRQGESDSVPPARQEELKPLLTRTMELLPTVKNEHWGTLCQAILALEQRGVKDPRVLEIVKRRYLDPALSADESTQMLGQFDPRGSQELFAKRLQVEMALAKTPKEMKEQEEEDWDFDRPVVGRLLDGLHSDRPERERFILEAMDHPHSGVRIEGFQRWFGLPEREARPRLRKALGDSSARVRILAAESLTQLSATNAQDAGDLAVLHAQLKKERDKEVVEALQAAINRLE